MSTQFESGALTAMPGHLQVNKDKRIWDKGISILLKGSDEQDDAS